MKTKNYEITLGFYHCWYNWALPLHIIVESIDEDYFEIDVQILCFAFSLIGLSCKWIDEINAGIKVVEENTR